MENNIRDARMHIAYLKKALADGNTEASISIAEQLDLKLHQMEAYRKCPENKKAIVIAFIQGMETQKTISLITSLGTKEQLDNSYAMNKGDKLNNGNN